MSEENALLVGCEIKKDQGPIIKAFLMEFQQSEITITISNMFRTWKVFFSIFKTCLVSNRQVLQIQILLFGLMRIYSNFRHLKIWRNFQLLVYPQKKIIITLGTGEICQWVYSTSDDWTRPANRWADSMA